jgi:nucleoside-diphosphate-sugar epimerase
MDDPKQRCPDITLARKLLNWAPEVQFDDGIGKAIRWFKEQKRA